MAALASQANSVIARVAPDDSKKTHDFAGEFILPKSTVFTDEQPCYVGLSKPLFERYWKKYERACALQRSIGKEDSRHTNAQT